MRGLLAAARCLIIAALLTKTVQAASFLSFPVAEARSHQFCALRVGQALAARGHNFTLLTTDQDGLSAKTLGSRAFSGLHIVKFQAPPITAEARAELLSRDPTKGMAKLQTVMLAVAHALYADKATLQKLRDSEYDVLLKDPLNWPAALLEDALDIPSIDLFSFSPLQPLFGEYVDIPNPIAYLPQIGSGLPTNMNFWQRCQNYLQSFIIKQIPARLAGTHQKAFMKESGLRVQTYEQGYSRSVAAISAADWAIEFPHPVPPNVHLVGPMNADPTQPLPADLHTFVEQGMRAGHGALYVSMGTIVQLTEAELRSVAASLSALPNPVIWKLASHDLPSDVTRTSLGAPNIKFVSWAPQNDVLGHPAVKAFITHAGSNSIHEAGYHGKPVICIPMLADQFDQAARAVYHGFGLKVLPKQLSSSQPLSKAIARILQESQFMANAKKVQKRLINKPRHPADLAADICERVVATGAEPYLKTRVHSLTWSQMSLLDVKLCLLAAAATAVATIVSVFWLGVKAVSGALGLALGRQGKGHSTGKKHL